MQKKQWLNYKSTTIHTTVPYIYKKTNVYRKLNGFSSINNTLTNTARVNNTGCVVKSIEKQKFFIFVGTKSMIFPNIITSANIFPFPGPIQQINILVSDPGQCSYCLLVFNNWFTCWVCDVDNKEQLKGLWPFRDKTFLPGFLPNETIYLDDSLNSSLRHVRLQPLLFHNLDEDF